MPSFGRAAEPAGGWADIEDPASCQIRAEYTWETETPLISPLDAEGAGFLVAESSFAREIEAAHSAGPFPDIPRRMPCPEGVQRLASPGTQCWSCWRAWARNNEWVQT
eukprot:9468552-Pyramimonas_sp.AAC.1